MDGSERSPVKSSNCRKVWRRGSESNRRIKVLQTSPLPLGYRAPAQYVSVPSGKSLSARENLREEKWSGRRGSNSRLQPWQGCALPLSYSRPAKVIINEGLSGGNGDAGLDGSASFVR